MTFSTPSRTSSTWPRGSRRCTSRPPIIEILSPNFFFIVAWSRFPPTGCMSPVRFTPRSTSSCMIGE